MMQTVCAAFASKGFYRARTPVISLDMPGANRWLFAYKHIH